MRRTRPTPRTGERQSRSSGALDDVALRLHPRGIRDGRAVVTRICAPRHHGWKRGRGRLSMRVRKPVLLRPQVPREARHHTARLPAPQSSCGASVADASNIRGANEHSVPECDGWLRAPLQRDPSGAERDRERLPSTGARPSAEDLPAEVVCRVLGVGLLRVAQTRAIGPSGGYDVVGRVTEPRKIGHVEPECRRTSIRRADPPAMFAQRMV